MHGPTESGLKRLRLSVAVQRSIAVNNVWMTQGRGGARRFSARRVSCLGRSRSLLPCQILLGEALFPRLGFPIIIPNPPAVCNHSAAKLTKHGFCRDDGNLPRPIRVGEDFLAYQIILFRLGGDDFVQRTVFIEEEIRITITQHPCALGCQHEQFVASIRHEKRSTFILSTS